MYLNKKKTGALLKFLHQLYFECRLYRTFCKRQNTYFLKTSICAFSENVIMCISIISCKKKHPKCPTKHKKKLDSPWKRQNVHFIHSEVHNTFSNNVKRCITNVQRKKKTFQTPPIPPRALQADTSKKVCCTRKWALGSQLREEGYCTPMSSLPICIVQR